MDECALFEEGSGGDGWPEWAGDGPCHSEAVCTNRPGYFTCSCKKGFYGDGRTCLCKENISFTTHLSFSFSSCVLPGCTGSLSVVQEIYAIDRVFSFPSSIVRWFDDVFRFLMFFENIWSGVTFRSLFWCILGQSCRMCFWVSSGWPHPLHVLSPEVRRGKYWGLGVFLLQYFPLAKI